MALPVLDINRSRKLPPGPARWSLLIEEERDRYDHPSSRERDVWQKLMDLPAPAPAALAAFQEREPDN